MDASSQKEMMTALLRDLRGRESEMVRLLSQFVHIESPSDDKAAVDRFGKIVAAEWRRRGAKVTFVRARERGDSLVVNLRGTSRGSSGTSSRAASRSRPRRIMLLGHLDTVYEMGTLAKMPFRVSRGRAWGPATFDMKGGIVLALMAIDSLKRCGIEIPCEIACVWTSDEEVGAPSSSALIEREARRSDVVLVLEPSGEPLGSLKTSRKGVGEIEIKVHGRAAHAGLKPEQGINAVQELAMQIARVMNWDDPVRGTRVHANVISGGTRTNVIAAEARALFDIRASSISEMRKLEKRFRSLRPILRGARLEIRGGFSRSPLERKMTGALYAHAQSLAGAMGSKLTEMAAGGGSDGNLTAAIGVPTLDGLGAVGAGAHSVNENIVIRELAPRAALIAGLLATL
jgi:glutamate carboxypeptidase